MLKTRSRKALRTLPSGKNGALGLAAGDWELAQVLPGQKAVSWRTVRHREDRTEAGILIRRPQQTRADTAWLMSDANGPLSPKRDWR